MMSKYSYNTKFSCEETLMRGSHLCALGMIKSALEKGADVNHENGAALANTVNADCPVKEKKEVISYLLSQGVQLRGDDTLLSLSILNRDQDLVEFCWSKVFDFEKEELSLLYALQEHNCDYVARLLKQGVKFSEKSLEYINDINNLDTQNACKDLYKVHTLNGSISIHSEAIHASIASLEQSILLGHHICEHHLP